MRTILFLLIVSNQVFSQKKLFDTLKIDATTKIIGRYPQYDRDKTYEKYNFIIEDSTQ
jgi:bisphosphoglycerate-independent phosphoglycerate mutase (AlkP superfamily)